MEMHTSSKAKREWYHPSVRPPYKKLLCRVAIHPQGCLYYAVWDCLSWWTFASNEDAALSGGLPMEAPFYWQPIRELVPTWLNTKPPGSGWYKVKTTSAAFKTSVYHAYWNGVQWSQLFWSKPFKKVSLKFADRQLLVELLR